MSRPGIKVEFDVSEFRGRFTVDTSDFCATTVEGIEAELRALVDEHAKANVSFYPQNITETVKSVLEAQAEERRAHQDELIEGYEARDMGDVEFTELALDAGMDLATIEKTLQSQREGADA